MDKFDFKNLLTNELQINPRDASSILENHDYTSRKIFELKNSLKNLFSDDFKDNICIFLVGSYGRLEASQNSDLDCIFIYKNVLTPKDKDKIKKLVFDSAKKIGIKKTPGDTGTFTEFIKLNTLLKNIGGIKDSNKNLTRRILILTESYFLYNDDLCNEVLSAIFNKYTKKANESGKEPRELINELVRYYRTVTIDYKHKIEEQKKSWGIRNIKLRHSRKLLYFTSIAIIFTSMKKFKNINKDKFEYMLANINYPPIMKLARILIEHNDKEYLFSWNEVPGNDSGRLIDFLKQNYNIEWVKTARIEKIDGIKTIRVSTEKNFLLLKLNDDKTELKLKIDDSRSDKFAVKIENGRLNIYNNLYQKIFIYYNNFLRYLGNAEIRKELENLPYDKRLESHNFREFKRNSDSFDDCLKHLIKNIDGWDKLIYKYIVF